MAKAHATLRAAIMNGMTPDQQKELAALITEMAVSAKEYGMDLDKGSDALSKSVSRANRVWNEIQLLGLNTKF